MWPVRIPEAAAQPPAPAQRTPRPRHSRAGVSGFQDGYRPRGSPTDREVTVRNDSEELAITLATMSRDLLSQPNTPS